MLCDLARSFPPKVAELLERDRGLKRNFREESVTDLLMASLIGLEPFGIRVDFPDEPTTGGDMDWIFAAPHDMAAVDTCASCCRRSGPSIQSRRADTGTIIT
jgi:hypothetical protein